MKERDLDMYFPNLNSLGFKNEKELLVMIFVMTSCARNSN